MAWLISEALMTDYENSHCSRGLVGASSEACNMDGEPCAPSRKTLMPRAYLPKDKMMGFSKLSRYGMTFVPLTENRGEDVLTWFLVGFRVKTYQARDEARELKAHEADCGSKWHGSFTRYDRDTSSWKTPQCSLLEVLESYSETWPRWGLMRGGACWAQPTLVRRMIDKDCGWWPTPTCHNAKEGGYPAEHERNTPTLGARVGGKPNPMWVEWLMGFPQGWSDLSGLETPKCQVVPPRRGEY